MKSLRRIVIILPSIISLDYDKPGGQMFPLSIGEQTHA
jgi:hypothetical protein